MGYDYSELRGLIRAKFGTCAAFAEAMGMNPCTLSLKLNSHLDWTKQEMLRACELLGISIDDAPRYFFCEKS